MNRFQFRAASLVTASRTAGTLSPTDRLHASGVELDFPFRLFIPEHYEARYAYPVVIWLHSHASSHREIEQVMPSVSLRNYVGFAPRGTLALPQQERRFGWGGSLEAFQQAEEMVLEAVEEVGSKLSVNRQRVFLAGHGLGGSLAQWIGLRNCPRFAGVVSIHGGFPSQFQPLRQWKVARKLPVLFMYGEQSRLCDARAVCLALEHSRQAGLNYQFTQFDSGDDFYTDMGQMANRFMMQIVTQGVDQRSLIGSLADAE